MIFPRQWKSIVAPMTIAMVAAVALGTSPGIAQADVVFRKKPVNKAAPAPAQPTGGEIGTGADAEAPKGPVKLQAEDPDDPGSAEAKASAAAAAALVKSLPPPPPPRPPIYKRWKFWAVVGAAVVGAVAVVWGTSALIHKAHGGDVQSCPTTDIGCFGEGR